MIMKREEAIKTVKNNWPEGRVMLQEALQTLIPELNESEDERMRAMAIKAVYASEAQSCIKSWGINPDDVIAWLEKQGAQKPIISHNALREGIAHFGITQYQIDNWLKKYVDIEKQEEQIMIKNEEKVKEARPKDEQYAKVLSKSSTEIHKMILEKYMKKSLNITDEIFEKIK